MKVKIKATTIYEDEPDEFIVIRTVDVRSPDDDEDPADWANDELLQFTGTGRTSGEGGYFVEVLDCDDRPDLRGVETSAFG